MNVVGHNLHFYNFRSGFCGNTIQYFFESDIYPVYQHWTPILRTPDYMVLTRVDDIVVRLE